MVQRSGALWPMKQPVRFSNRDVIDAGMANCHQASLAELPILIAVTAVPLPVGVPPFVGETHADAWPAERPQLLDEPVVKFTVPLAAQELAHLLAPDRPKVTAARATRLARR